MVSPSQPPGQPADEPSAQSPHQPPPPPHQPPSSEELQPDRHCFVCGRENEHGLRVAFRREGSQVRATFVPGPGVQGYDGLAHGGVLTAVLDDAMAQCLYQRGLNAYTGRIAVRFRRPVAIGARLEVYGELVDERAAFATARAWATTADGALVVEAESTLIRTPASPAEAPKGR